LIVLADLKVCTTPLVVQFADVKVCTTPLVVQAFRPAVTLAAQEPPRPSFADWLNGVRAEAITRGIRPEILDEAFGGGEEPLPIVIERDRSQAELLLPLEDYISRRLTPKVIKTGREMYAAHRKLLDQVSDRYGVPAKMIVAVWGIESNFGKFSGVRP